MNKKGVSGIIVTVLLIGIAITTIAIVWVVINNLILDRAGSLSTQGITLNLKIISVTLQTNNINVMVKRHIGEGNLIGIKFIVEDSVTSESFEENTSMQELEQGIFSLGYLGDATKISIAPIYQLESGKVMLGQITDTYEISSGSSTCTSACEGKSCGSDGCGGSCGTCPTGYSCNDGVCSIGCTPDCEGKVCGDNGCGGICGICGGEETCQNGLCTICTPDCGTRECGEVPNACGESCGTCESNEICTEGTCNSVLSINSGTVYSVWPTSAATLFDSPDLPTATGTDYTGHYAKFPNSSESRCLQIENYVTPLFPEIYNMSYIKFVTSYTNIQANDYYEIWESYEYCTS